VTVLDHVGMQCADMAASAAFYDAVLFKSVLETGTPLMN